MNRKNYLPFVAGMWLASTEGREPMTEAEASYNFPEWLKCGINIPEGLTPCEYAKIWNALCSE